MTDEKYGEGPVKFFVLSVTKPEGSVKTDAGCKLITKGDHGTESDNDLHYLKNEFINKLAEKPNVFECHVDATVGQFWEEDLDKFMGDQNLKDYKCFIFVFFTYMSSINGDISDEQIHLKNGKISISKIWDKLKMVEGMVGCPKIFLVQADDLSLLREPQGDKGPPPSPPKKIPQEADRLTILSTIPSNVTSEGILLKTDMENKSWHEVKPSLLMEAFVDAVIENDKQTNGDKLDMLSLTIDINRRVDDNLEELKRTNKVQKDLPIPLITSTLTKFLYLPKLKEDESTSEDE